MNAFFGLAYAIEREPRRGATYDVRLSPGQFSHYAGFLDPASTPR